MLTYKPFEWNPGYLEETWKIKNNIKFLKETTNLSYRKLSVELGFKPKVLLNYVYGQNRPNLERLGIIAKYFGLDSIEDFAMNEDEFSSKYSKLKSRA